MNYGVKIEDAEMPKMSSSAAADTKTQKLNRRCCSFLCPTRHKIPKRLTSFDSVTSHRHQSRTGETSHCLNLKLPTHGQRKSRSLKLLSVLKFATIIRSRRHI